MRVPEAQRDVRHRLRKRLGWLGFGSLGNGLWLTPHVDRESELASALADLHGRGLRIVGSEADAPLAVRDADLRGPLALVVGSEGQGLGSAVRRRSDLLVRVPMRGAIGSLNAAVAGSILLYEALSQRGASPGSSAASETRPKRRAKTATEPKKGPRVASEASAPETTPPTEADDLPPDGPSAGG